MGKKKGNTTVYFFLEKIEKHFAYLIESNKMKEQTRQSFFVDFLGCSPTIYRNWWNNGIKKLYISILFLLEEIEEHRERIRILEKQLNEIIKK